MITSIDDDQLQLEVSAQVYEPEALLRTAYQFNDRCFVHIDSVLDNTLRVHFKKNNNSDVQLEYIVDQFCRVLVDQQIRVTTEKNFGGIRDEIVRQAFAPIESKQ